MNIGDALELAIKLAKAGSEIAKVVKDNVATGKITLEADSLAALQAILEPLHEKNMEASAKLDAALAEASSR